MYTLLTYTTTQRQSMLHLKYYTYFHLLNFLKISIPKWITVLALEYYNFHFYLINKTLLPFLFFCKKTLFLKGLQLSDICVIDFPTSIKQRFQIIYIITSPFYNTRFLLSLFTPSIATLFSIKQLFYNANWLEREVWDLFGLFFIDNLDLRRLLTDYGFIGHPLRKDFPLTGFYEILYNDKLNLVIYEKLTLAQTYKNYYFFNPWQVN